MIFEKLHLKDIYPFLGSNGCDPVLECYLPDNMQEANKSDIKRPCMVVCPGGGYSFCSRREAEPIAFHFLPEGYNVFVLTYSVAPHCFPTQLIEVAAVMDYINANAEKLHCNVDKVLIMGFSAGGHLAAHYSNMFNCPEVRSVFADSKPVAGSVLCYPVISAEPSVTHRYSIINVSGSNEITQNVIEKFSCEKLVSDNTPPTFLWHTAPDDCVPVMNSLRYATALSQHKIPYEMHIYPIGGHGMSTSDFATYDQTVYKDKAVIYVHQWLDNLKSWLKLMGFTN